MTFHKSSDSTLYVIKRSGQHEPIKFDKITSRLNKLFRELKQRRPDLARTTTIEPVLVTQRVIQQVTTAMHTHEIDTLTAETCASMMRYDPDYDVLAGSITISNAIKTAPDTFSKAMEAVDKQCSDYEGEKGGYMDAKFMEAVRTHREELDRLVEDTMARNYEYDTYSAAQLWCKKYCHHVFAGKNSEANCGDSFYARPKVLAEVPTYVLMRVALAVELGSPDEVPDGALVDMERVRRSYELLSTQHYIHATPTLYNAGKADAQYSSCYLLRTHDDSIVGIYKTLADAAKISQKAAGLGIYIHNIRPAGSIIHSSGEKSSGIVPMLRVFNNTARYVDQGGGKRKGAMAMYLEPSHPDVMHFLDLRKNVGAEEDRTRDLFLALWVPDLFMKRVEEDGDWILVDPKSNRKLEALYGEEYEREYERHEREGLYMRKVKAREVWDKILESQMETGTPYLLAKDACNRKSNQKNLGTISSSNLCAEIVQYTSPEEIAVCNLASIILPRFVRQHDAHTKCFDFEALYNTVRDVARRLDQVIDLNSYPVPEARTSNMLHRPMGIGVQGLQDVFFEFFYPFDSQEARDLNIAIAAVMYYAAVRASVDMAKTRGRYKTYEGSPASQGMLQFDLWSVEPLKRAGDFEMDWDGLKADMAQHGLRNSLLIALMPTASTSTLNRRVESFEPLSYNCYVRHTDNGSYYMWNHSLRRTLAARGLWDETMATRILKADGSIQDSQAFPDIPDDVKKVYRTIFEVKVRPQLEMSADRGPYVCQSQSLNVNFKKPTVRTLTQSHFLAWKLGLKTLSYYVRREAEAEAIKFTVDAEERETKRGTTQAQASDASVKSVKSAEGPTCTIAMRAAGCDSCGA